MNQMWFVAQAPAGRSIREENLGFWTINCRPNASPLHRTYLFVFVNLSLLAIANLPQENAIALPI
ncbi:hypothetical protein ACE1B6_03415 [Aerosakkonemataceae cyanobacterium BLCC-F154]|uniref:Uncharacterized protein n=1 Tax=Floridaenema fluviatile BLCC-F154 TaxID=3153640 RepID=A0ABV4Y848_9CYAN